ncbi:NB-ARC domain-containing protein [Sphaerisporangium sp. NBC_01403]|uniref:AfsR/SARP family transcriptional regulator n=1 Tax=Sphaerisporangium sp. NBC_01403 TaxID=2903599 RepID=UPI00324BA425
MKFRVIGDVAVLGDTGPVRLASRRQEQLLGLLICWRGRTVPADTLTDALWGERLAARPGKNLQVLVHRLRRSLGSADRIRHDRSGYALLAQRAEVDAWHFTDLAERGRRALGQGDPEMAAALLHEALALWGGGTAYPGLHDVPQLAEAAADLEQERRRVLTDRIDAEMALGRHAQVIPELVALLAEDPLAESSAARLMVAMHRAGRRADALGVYRRTRAVLAEELGVEPGPLLRELEGAILRGDADITLAPLQPAGPGPAAAPPPAPAGDLAPALLPAPTGDLTGRDAELRRIMVLLHGPPVVCVVSGMPGVGKTAVAVQAAQLARERFPDGQLFVNLRGAGTGRVEPREALGRFLRALGVAGTHVPDGLDERAEVFRDLLSDRRVLVVLDDAADEAQVEPLIPAGAGCAVLITSRGRLTALPAANLVALGVLGTGDAIDLLSRITGRAELREGGPAARELAELCDRLPLALRIAGARLAARPHWTVARLISRLEAEHDRLDELTHGTLSVRAGLALGYSGLTDPGRSLFRRLGLVETPDFAAWVAAALLGTGSRAAEDVLESLVEAQLVEYAGTDGIGEPRYRIHDLVRLHARERAAADEAPDAGDAALARLAGAYLALAERAHRSQYGGDYTVLHGGGARWHLEEPTTVRLLADPAGWLRSERPGLVAAVEQAAGLGLSEICWDLAMSTVTLFESQGHFDDWSHTARTALATARRTGDLRGEAAMRYSLGTLEIFRQRYAAARPHFAAALPIFETVGDPHGQALALRNAALLDRVEGNAETALGQYGRALRMLRAVGDRHAEAHVLGSIAQIHIENDHGEAAAPLLEQALGVYLELGDGRGSAQILNRLGLLHLREGRASEAETAYRQVLDASRGAGDKIGETYGLLGMGEAGLLAGELDRAADYLDAALALAVTIGEPFVAARARLAGGKLAAGRGEHQLAASMLERAAAEFDAIGLPLWHERAREARRALDTLSSPPAPG